MASTNPRIPATSSLALLRSGDRLPIALQSIPDRSNSAVQIEEEGLISLPCIGHLTASGVTPGELSQRIRDTYIEKKIYRTLDLSVMATEHYIYIGGEVSPPARIIWTPDLTRTKTIQSVGGFTFDAKESRGTLDLNQAAHDLNVTRAQKNPAQDVSLMPGDLI